MNSSLITKEGWLMKEGGTIRNKWQNRWFRLQGRTINYYLKKGDNNPQDVIQLDDVKNVSKVGEHSGKPHCMAMVTTKDKGKKVYYLAVDSETILNEWIVAFNTNLAPDVPIMLFKYSTAEVFISQGIRITGDVNYEILSFISHLIPVEKKKRDNFGWFCDRHISVETVLNLFAGYNWSPDRIYRSTAVSGTDTNVVLPVVRILFSKSPVVPESRTLSKSFIGFSSNYSSNHFDGSGKLFDVLRGAAGKLSGNGRTDVNPSPITSVIHSETAQLEGTDDELILLMQEFDIPLSLLEVP